MGFIHGLEIIAEVFSCIIGIIVGVGIYIAIPARIIYKAVKYPGQGEATKLVRDLLNIWDPITGVPRSIVGKENQTIVIEEEKDRE
jgi:hypothetical protein